MKYLIAGTLPAPSAAMVTPAAAAPSAVKPLAANARANLEAAMNGEALKLGSTSVVNLEDAIAGEGYENSRMYIEFTKQSDTAGDSKVAAMFRQIAEDEGTH